MRRLLAVLVLPALAIAGCSEIGDQISDSVNQAAAAVLEQAISDELAKAGIELDGPPDCSTDLSRTGSGLSGTGSCAATTADGQSARATFDGTLSSSGCTGALTVEVEGRTVVDLDQIPDCSVSL